MKSKAAAVLAVAMIVFSVTIVNSVLVMAQDKGAKTPPQTAKFSGLSKGSELINSNRTYVFLPTVRAYVGAGRAEALEEALHRLGINAGTALEKKGNFLIINSPNNFKKMKLTKDSQGILNFPVVMNADSGEIGVVSGEIKVKISDMQEADGLAMTHGLDIKGRIAAIGIVFLSTPQDSDITIVLQNLRKDPRVVRADLNIVENPNIPQ